ncbi:unnamed protein product [Somion occarium]|uniref:Uncharacterized protein n=1 Tax=Somion occarium TaxID=3059160 RepID=A0ABP1DRB7_9APHY
MAAPVEARAAWDVKSAALAYVGKEWNVTPLYDVYFDSAVQGANGTYAFLRQKTNDLPVDNTFATVVFDANHNVQQFKSYRVPATYVEVNMPTISIQDAANAGEAALSGLTWTSEPENYGYIARSDGHIAFAYILHLKDSQGTVYVAYVNTRDGTIESLTNTQTGVNIVPH